MSLQAALKDIPPYHQEYMITMLEDRKAGRLCSVSLKYRYLPVPVREFITGAEYLNKPVSVYAVVMSELEQVNNGQYVEAVFTGGIGSGKSTAAIYTTAYQLYLLGCLRNPHVEYDLDPTSEIVLLVQSLNAKSAGVDYARIKNLVLESPFFQKYFPFNPKITSKLVFPNNIQVIPVAGTPTAAIGENVIGGIIDEINSMAIVEKSKKTRDSGVFDQAVKVYNSIARRRKSRFMKQGKQAGILCLVSSRIYPNEFTQRKEQEALSDKTIYVYDHCTWTVNPNKFKGDTWFKLFIGDASRKPKIIEDPDDPLLNDPLYIRDIPTSFRTDFEKDMTNSLREIAGVSTLATSPFLPALDLVKANFGKHPSIFSSNTTDFVTDPLKLLHGNFLHKYIPRWAHIDLAVTGDNAGLTIGTISGFANMDRGDYVETMPMIHIDGALEVRAPKGGEIIFEKIRRILYLLKDYGLDIKWVSFDGFQSVDSRQILRGKGFKTGLLSLDRKLDPYLVTKAALYDGRISAPEQPKLVTELGSLELDVIKKKVDHPPHCSKDIADSFGGVVFGCTMRRELWRYHGVSLHNLPHSLKDIKAVDAK